VSPTNNIAEMLERTYYKERIQTLEATVADLEEQIRKIKDGDQ
jgi:cell division protein FtsB